jgi:GcrA cell cycle regulator
MTDIFWTEQRVSDLKTLWGTGWTCTQIAAKIGGTRNAIIGKVHRLGLSGDSRTYRNAVERRKAQPSQDGESAPPPKAAPARRRQQGEAPAGSTAFKVLKKIRDQALGIDEPNNSYLVREATDVEPKHIDFMDLTNTTCRFPYGDAAPYTFCGCDVQIGSPYCSSHNRLCRPGGGDGAASQFGSEEHRKRISEALHSPPRSEEGARGMMGLTPVMMKCLDFLRAEAGAGRPAPSYDEIKAHLGISSRGRVCNLIQDLERRGAVRRYPQRQRSLEVIDPDCEPTISVHPRLMDALQKYARAEGVSVDVAVNQFVRDGLESA